MFAHGAGGIVSSTSAGEISLVSNYQAPSALTNNGYVVFDVNGANNNYPGTGSEHMGSSRAISAYLKAFNYIKQNYNVEDKLILVGQSMGGLLALNFVNKYPNLVKAIAAFYPVTDVYNQAFLHPWHTATKQMIAIEYNFTDQTGITFEHDKIIGYNPIENNSILISGTRYSKLACPLKIWHGTTDTTISLDGSQALVAALKNGGCNAELRTVTGMAHGMSPYSNIMYELLFWINRQY